MLWGATEGREGATITAVSMLLYATPFDELEKFRAIRDSGGDVLVAKVPGYLYLLRFLSLSIQ